MAKEKIWPSEDQYMSIEEKAEIILKRYRDDPQVFDFILHLHRIIGSNQSMLQSNKTLIELLTLLNSKKEK